MPMELHDFVYTVLAMRNAQRMYFSTRRKEDLWAAQDMERRIDDVIDEHVGQVMQFTTTPDQKGA